MSLISVNYTSPLSDSNINRNVCSTIECVNIDICSLLFVCFSIFNTFLKFIKENLLGTTPGSQLLSPSPQQQQQQQQAAAPTKGKGSKSGGLSCAEMVCHCATGKHTGPMLSSIILKHNS